MEPAYLHVVWFVVAALAAMLLVPACWGVFPERRTAGLLLIPTVSSLALFFWPVATVWLFAADLAIVGVLLVDLSRFPRTQSFRAWRLLTRVASLNRRHAITVGIENRSTRNWRAVLRDDLSPDMGLLPPDLHTDLPPGEAIQWQYTWVPRRRGAYRLQYVHARVASPWRLWARYYRFPVHSEVHVYPNVRQLSEFSLLARTNRLSLLGVRKTRKCGQDHDFERLRDYTTDDNFRHIDWRATARRRKLTVKDFQTSQSQRLVLMIDCGRMMINQSGGMAMLDYALDAALLLGYVALKQGDAVGLVCFDDQVRAFVPPRSGRHQMRFLLQAAFDRHAQMVEARYDLAFLRLTSSCRKRSLVVLITNVLDRVNAARITQHLEIHRGRHLTLAVLLRDPALFGPLDRLPHLPTGSLPWYVAAAAADVATWRHEVIGRLRHAGHLVLDVSPSELSAELVSHYLAIKAWHLL